MSKFKLVEKIYEPKGINMIFKEKNLKISMVVDRKIAYEFIKGKTYEFNVTSEVENG
jgi:hypothetical protein